jgi:hypothetical protein
MRGQQAAAGRARPSGGKSAAAASSNTASNSKAGVAPVLKAHTVDGVLIPGVRVLPPEPKTPKAKAKRSTSVAPAKKDEEEAAGGFGPNVQTLHRDIYHLRKVFPGESNSPRHASNVATDRLRTFGALRSPGSPFCGFRRPLTASNPSSLLKSHPCDAGESKALLKTLLKEAIPPEAVSASISLFHAARPNSPRPLTCSLLSASDFLPFAVGSELPGHVSGRRKAADAS